MIASFIITFRETLEAALIVGIILAYLLKTKKTKYNNLVHMGVVSAVVASIIGAFLFNNLAGGFTGTAEQIFEGVAMLSAAFLLTFMIMWMMKQRHVIHELHEKLDIEIKEQHKVGLFMVVFVSVLREGIETVLFLGAASFVSGENSMVGAITGIIAAVILGYFMFVASKKINLKKFFNATSAILVFFAAGLVAHGVHEFQEAKLLPTYVEHVWDINPALNLDGSFPAMHEKGAVGSILKGLLGYNGNPSLIEVFSYLVYLVFAFVLWKNIEKVHKVI